VADRVRDQVLDDPFHLRRIGVDLDRLSPDVDPPIR
jgi:hypothetical protein